MCGLKEKHVPAQSPLPAGPAQWRTSTEPPPSHSICLLRTCCLWTPKEEGLCGGPTGVGDTARDAC